MKLATVMVPAALVVILCMGVKFPPTERAASGISMGAMFRELLKPMFLVLFCSMFLTAARSWRRDNGLISRSHERSGCEASGCWST